MKVLFYGRLAESIGRELEVDAEPGCSVAQLRQKLAGVYPEAAATLASKRARACVRDTIVADDYRPDAGETLEFLPPVSGG